MLDPDRGRLLTYCLCVSHSRLQLEREIRLREHARSLREATAAFYLKLGHIQALFVPLVWREVRIKIRKYLLGGRGGVRAGRGGSGVGAGAGVQGPAALPVQGQDLVVEGHERWPMTDGDAGAPQLLDHVAEPLLHIHLQAMRRYPLHVQYRSCHFISEMSFPMSACKP